MSTRCTLGGSTDPLRRLTPGRSRQPSVTWRPVLRRRKLSAAWLKANTEQEKSTFGELSVKERLIGFGMCYVGGFIISILGAILLITGSGEGFAVFFGVGAIISLVGTGFLM